MSSTDIATQETEQALTQQAGADLADSEDLVVPILKICQSLTNEVVEGEAKPGDFLNALTGESYGNEVDFVVAGFQKGRFVERDGKVFLAYAPIVPESWVHEDDKPFVGKPFSEHPDAEEAYKAAVNSDQKEWGSGPPISTTYNFTGYVTDSEVPVRLALMRTQQPVARKWTTMLRFLPALWDSQFHLTTEKVQSKSGQPYNTLRVKQAGKPESENRQRAVDLAQAVVAQRAQFVGDATDAEAKPTKKPDAKGGLEV